MTIARLHLTERLEHRGLVRGAYSSRDVVRTAPPSPPGLPDASGPDTCRA